ncbi:MAG: fumarylacetoacetate hydrolase family protein [Chloroflexi bacterium]|nr:fumarylacetoacetate hydrolase family protein [Chloroflexota bacterium]
MRIVRFIESFADVAPEYLTPRWGMLVDQVVYRLQAPPYVRPLRAGIYAPQVVGEPVALENVTLLAPVRPRKIICVGRNYAEHAAELGNQVPPEPLIFLKPPTTLIGPNEAIVYPDISKSVHHEGELAVVIGEHCRHLNEADATRVIFGYTLANDVTARDLQKGDGQWTRGKGFDTFCPVGPWIDTSFEPADRAVRCYVNEEVRQNGNTSLMIYSLGRILAFVSQFMTLEPGDLILTGTPAGVGPLQPGDTVRVEIEQLGTLSNPVISQAEAQQRDAARQAELDEDMPF